MEKKKAMLPQLKIQKNGDIDSIDEHKRAFSCTFLVSKNGEITTAERVRDRFLEKKKATLPQLKIRKKFELWKIRIMFFKLKRSISLLGFMPPIGWQKKKEGKISNRRHETYFKWHPMAPSNVSVDEPLHNNQTHHKSNYGQRVIQFFDSPRCQYPAQSPTLSKITSHLSLSRQLEVKLVGRAGKEEKAESWWIRQKTIMHQNST